MPITIEKEAPLNETVFKVKKGGFLASLFCFIFATIILSNRRNF